MSEAALFLIVLVVLVVLAWRALAALRLLERTLAEMAHTLDTHLSDIRERLNPTLDEIDSHLEHEAYGVEIEGCPQCELSKVYGRPRGPFQLTSEQEQRRREEEMEKHRKWIEAYDATKHV